jgi:transcriptional regulator with XRE-family HTH domain
MSPSARRLRKTIHSAEHLALMELLAAERDKAGLTQQKLAKRLGKHQSFVAKYEGGSGAWMDDTRLPLDWSEQRRTLGFVQPL